MCVMSLLQHASLQLLFTTLLLPIHSRLSLRASNLFWMSEFKHTRCGIGRAFTEFLGLLKDSSCVFISTSAALPPPPLPLCWSTRPAMRGLPPVFLGQSLDS